MSIGSPHVVVVDDEPLLLELVAEDLRDAGYKVTAFERPVDALEFLGGDASVELLLTDVRMPGMSGVALAERAVMCRPDLKVMMMTGFAGDLDDLIDLGRLPLLKKPFPLEVLRDEVGRSLGG